MGITSAKDDLKMLEAFLYGRPETDKPVGNVVAYAITIINDLFEQERMLRHTVEQLLAEIRDGEAREADYRNRAEVAESYRAYYETRLEGKISPPDPKAIVIHSDGTVTAPWQDDDGNANPEVYRVEDGHTFEVPPWSSMEGKCHLCGHPETIHIQVTS